MIEMICGDNMEVMKSYGDGFFDVAIADLEYGIGASRPSKKNVRVRQKNGGFVNVNQSDYGDKDWDDKRSGPEYFEELFRVCKDQIIWGANYYENLPGGKIVWDKVVADGADQYSCEIAYQSFSNRMDIVYYMWSGMMQGIYCGRDRKRAMVQQGNKQLNEKRIHPTQKPVKLYEWVLDRYIKRGSKILDTHGGSMSLAVAVDNMNKYDNMDYHLVICEIDKEQFKKSKRRVEKNMMVKSLW